MIKSLSLLCLLSTIFSVHAMENTEQYLHQFGFDIDNGRIRDQVSFIDRKDRHKQLKAIALQDMKEKYPSCSVELTFTRTTRIEKKDGYAQAAAEYLEKNYSGHNADTQQKIILLKEQNEYISKPNPCKSCCWQLIKRLASWCCEHKKQQ